MTTTPPLSSLEESREALSTEIVTADTPLVSTSTNESAHVPPMPPIHVGPPFVPRPRGGRRPLLLALALLATLGLGMGAGAALANAHNAGIHTSVIGATSAPAVTISSSTTSLQTDVEHVAK